MVVLPPCSEEMSGIVLKRTGLGFEEWDARRLAFAYASNEDLQASWEFGALGRVRNSTR